MSGGLPATGNLSAADPPSSGSIGRRGLLALLAIELLALAGGTVLFVGLFHTPVFSAMDVLFYRGIGLLLLATALTAVALVVLRRVRFPGLIGWRDILLVAALLFSGNLVFFTHFPVTADRSVSVFMLGYLDQRRVELTRQEIEDVLVERYVVAAGAAEKRLEEQIVSGNLAVEDGRYRITDQGRALMASYRVIAGLFGIDTRNVAP